MPRLRAIIMKLMIGDQIPRRIRLANDTHTLQKIRTAVVAGTATTSKIQEKMVGVTKPQVAVIMFLPAVNGRIDMTMGTEHHHTPSLHHGVPPLHLIIGPPARTNGQWKVTAVLWMSILIPDPGQETDCLRRSQIGAGMDARKEIELGPVIPGGSHPMMAGKTGKKDEEGQVLSPKTRQMIDHGGRLPAGSILVATKMKDSGCKIARGTIMRIN